MHVPYHTFFTNYPSTPHSLSYNNNPIIKINKIHHIIYARPLLPLLNFIHPTISSTPNSPLYNNAIIKINKPNHIIYARPLLFLLNFIHSTFLHLSGQLGTYFMYPDKIFFKF